MADNNSGFGQYSNFSFDIPSASPSRTTPSRPLQHAIEKNTPRSPFSSNDDSLSNQEYKPTNPFCPNNSNFSIPANNSKRYKPRDRDDSRQDSQPRNTRIFENSKSTQKFGHYDNQASHENQKPFLNERKNTNYHQRHHSPQQQTYHHQQQPYTQQQQEPDNHFPQHQQQQSNLHNPQHKQQQPYFHNPQQQQQQPYFHNPQQQQQQPYFHNSQQQQQQSFNPQQKTQKHNNRYHQQNQHQHQPPPPPQQQQSNQVKNKGAEKKFFWKDKKLQSQEEQLQYIGHCRSWCKPDKEESYVVEKIREAIEPLESILEEDNLHYDVIRQLIDLLSKKHFLSPHTSCCESANAILIKLIDSKLIQSSKNLSGFLTDVFEDINDDNFFNGRGPFNDNRKLVYQVSQLLNSLLDRFPSEFQSLSVCISTLKDKFQNSVCAAKFDDQTQCCIIELHTKYSHLKKRSKEKEAKHHEKKQLEDNDTYYGNLYNDTSILPTFQELVTSDPIKLRKLLTTEGYPDALRYLDIHFKLLREDMVRPLREGIQHFISNAKIVKKELYIYDTVKIVDMHCDQNQGLLYKISFKTFGIDPTKIKWDRSPRLKYGTLLLITPLCKDGKPNFEKGMWAVVAHRDEKELTKNLSISIKFDKNPFQPSFEFGEEYFMVESKQVYYEAYYHTLSVIQNMNPECLPLQKIILGQQKIVGPPQYLTQNTMYNFGEVFPYSSTCFRTLGQWPKESPILDESQLKALKLALTKEVALIQGPPGTGKTYVGAHVMRILLENRRSLLEKRRDLMFHPSFSQMDPQSIPINMRLQQPTLTTDETKLHETLCELPMLVVTYTNHALDQFLEYLLGFEPSIVRIGSKIEKEELKNKTLPAISKEILTQHDVPQEIKKYKRQKYDLSKEMDSKKTAILNISKILLRDYLTKEDLQNLVTPAQFNSLYSSEVANDGLEMVKGNKNIIDVWLNQYTRTPTLSQSRSDSGRSNNSKNKKITKNSAMDFSNRFASLKGMDDGNEDEDFYSTDDIQRKRLENLGFNIPDEYSRQSSAYSNVPNELNDTYNSRKPSTPTQTFSNIEFTHADHIAAQLAFEQEYASPFSNTEFGVFDLPSPIYPTQQTNNLIPNNILDDETFLHHASDDDDEVDALVDTDTFDTLDVYNLTIGDAMQIYGAPLEGLLPNLPAKILNCNNLWTLAHNDRKLFHDYLILRRKIEVNQVLSGLSTEYSNLSKEYKEKQRQLDIYVLKQSAVVGMTTTGAARYTELLKELKPKIIFIEEAAEVLEAHVIACLSEHVQHLVLIGDHQQLKPSNAVHELTHKYNLALSLFERLICVQIEHVTLSNQHRMRPEISRLLKPIYEDLVDHPCVLHRPPIKGVMRNVFFIDHRVPEDQLEEDTTSRKNIHEAKFIAHLAKYLIKQGYATSDIIILTFYLGQKFKIMDQLKSIAPGYNIKVTTVDRFQGEESKIILFSVVRSNTHNDIGYCRADNRVCVALSRAQDGFYMIGNSACLKNARSDTGLWSKVFEQLGPDNIGPHLPLACQKHPQTFSMVATHQDFQKVKNGGCTLLCDERLSCGHQCQQLCHPDGHESVECKKDCEQILACGHRCYRPGGKVLKKCYEECGDCNVMVEKILDVCNHKVKLACHQPPDHCLCQMACIKMLPCMHRCQGMCGEECLSMNCFTDVQVKLCCGHNLTIPCWQKNNLLDVECKEPCDYVLKCGDKCPGTCGSCLNGTRHAKCKNTCKAPLICQHECQENCHRPSVCLPCQKTCINRCRHTKCGKFCGEICVPCIEPCEWRCLHMACTKKCNEPCNRHRCDQPCQKRLRCKHPCLGLCGEPCPKLCRRCNPKDENFNIFFGTEEDDDARFVVLEDCNHIFEKTGLDHWMDEEKGGRTDKDKIQLPKCPNCNTAIRKNLRYGAIVKQALSDIETVKNRVINEMRITLSKECNNLLDTVQSLGNPNQTYKQILDYIQNIQICMKKCDHLKLYITRDILSVFSKMHDHSEHLWKNCVAHKILLQGPLLNKLLEKKEYSEFDNWDRDCLMSLSRRCEISSLFSSLTSGVDDYNDGSNLKQLQKRFTNSIMNSINHKNPDANNLMLKCEMFLSNVRLKYHFQPPTPEEMREIAQVVDVNRGGWYKCPNGHIYGIGNCGGATEISKCPECHATIGGTSHQITDGSTYAGPEMGGTAEPAWPNQFGAGNNMFFDD